MSYIVAASLMNGEWFNIYYKWFGHGVKFVVSNVMYVTILKLYIFVFQLSACIHATDILLFPLHWYVAYHTNCACVLLLLQAAHILSDHATKPDGLLLCTDAFSNGYP